MTKQIERHRVWCPRHNRVEHLEGRRGYNAVKNATERHDDLPVFDCGREDNAAMLQSR